MGRNFLLQIGLITLLISTALAQDSAKNPPPKREFRAVWIATVNNIDWPSKAGLPVAAQKKEFRAILDKALAIGLNAVIVQVRPASDAFYRSRFEPWSQWLTGTQGQPPAPFYDPLRFMIEESHLRGIEFHAWLNPFRAMKKSRFINICDEHISKRKPKWLLQYGDYVMLNPGIPDARLHVLRVVADIVQRYDIDGIHFDDYFYPYPDGKTKINDRATYLKYKGSHTSIADWRRSNINEFISSTSKTIKQFKPWVKFGVSPYGTWRNKRINPLGSNTLSGLSSYDHLYADVRKWLQHGWVDYVAPQLYQNTRHHNSNFKILINWWSDNAFGKHIYAGHAAYRMFSEGGGWTWRDKGEIPRQVRMARDAPNVQGSVYYSWNALKHNKGSIRDSLTTNQYPHIAIPPSLTWLDISPPDPPQEIAFENHNLGIKISWQPPSQSTEENIAKGYALYRFLKEDTVRDITNPQNLAAVVYGHTYCIDQHVYDTSYFDYMVTTLDRAGNESKPATRHQNKTPDTLLVIAQPVQEEKPIDEHRKKLIHFFLDLAKENTDRHFQKAKG